MMSMISLHAVKENKVLLNITNIGYHVKDVQKNSVPHQGMADFEATSNGVKTAIQVVVYYEVLTYTVTADVMVKLKHSFSDVLSNHLNPIPMKNPSPMLINQPKR